ncbi:MAG: pentapeptide repeat-containing protein [Nitrospinae bacterium]|nr:pentapeptide repeat-containing protein [Nitrospinota bacterium]
MIKALGWMRTLIDKIKNICIYLNIFAKNFPDRDGRFIILLLVAFLDLTVVIRYHDEVSEFIPGWCRIDSKEKVYLSLTLLSAPFAFFIWHWRDANNLAKIETDRYDLFLKDFYQIEQWATAAGGTTNETLKLAAIHQLLPFANGGYGLLFVRPAQEIFLSLLANSKGRGTDDIKAIHEIVKNNWKVFDKVRKNIDPAANSFLKGIILIANADFSNADFSSADFSFANLSAADFSNANLRGAKYSNATKFPDGFDPVKAGMEKT